MNAEVKHVMPAEVIGSTFERDPELVLPEFPRFIKELKMVPYGRDGILFLGTQGTQIISGKSARVFLPRLIAQLDGRRDLIALAKLFPQYDLKIIRNAVSLLYSRGLLEDGPEQPLADKTLAPLASFAGRYCDVTRINKSREVTLERLAEQTVTIVMDDENHHSEYVALTNSLNGLGFKQVICIGSVAELTPHSGLVVAVFFERSARQQAWMRQASALNLNVLHACLSAGRVELGPLIVPGLTGCYDCFDAVRNDERGCDVDDTHFWMGVIGLNVFHLVSRVGKNDLYGTCRVHRLDQLYDQFSQIKVTRLPGCKTCGLAKCNDPLSDEALKTWRLHNASIIVSGYHFRTPKEHQSHYAAANISISEAPAKPMLGVETIALPEALDVDLIPAWKQAARDQSNMTLEQLSALLRYTAGYQPVQGGMRRIAPSGGGLGSSEFYLNVRDIKGLDNGIYHYFAPHHTLQRLGDIADELLAGALGIATFELPQAVMICAANMEKLRQKYDNFSYRLSVVDAGVSQSYLLNLLASLDVPVTEYSVSRDKVLAHAFKMPTRGNKYHIAFVLGMGYCKDLQRAESLNMHHNFYVDQLIEAAHQRGNGVRLQCLADKVRDPAPQQQVASLKDILLTRRSVRHFADMGIAKDALTGILNIAHQMSELANIISQFEIRLTVYVAVTKETMGIAPGIFRYQDDQLLERGTLHDVTELEPMMLQRAFAQAPVVLFITGDLQSALSQYDAAGYRQVLKRVGTFAGSTVVAAQAYGIGGCIWGGLYEEMWGEKLAIDRFSECPLLGVSLGYAGDS